MNEYWNWYKDYIYKDLSFNYEDLFKYILPFMFKDPFFTKFLASRLKRLIPNFYEEIKNKTQFLPEDSKIKERIYCLIYKVKERPLCLYCKNNKVIFNNGKDKFHYKLFCSHECFKKFEKENRKYFQLFTKNQKQDTDFDFGLIGNEDEILVKYGQNTFLNKNLKSSLIQFYRKYFIEFLQQFVKDNEEIKWNRFNLQSLFEMYLKRNLNRCKECSKIVYSFDRLRSHLSSYCHNHSYLQTKETCLQKYGIDNYSKTEEFKKFLYETKPWLNKTYNKEKFKLTIYNRKKDTCLDNDIIMLFDVDDYKGAKEKHPFQCLKCGSIFYSKFNKKDKIIRCPNCNKTTLFERLIIDVLNKHKIPYEFKNQSIIKINSQQYEIDLYIKKYNLGIEINGVWFHRYEMLKKRLKKVSAILYHQKKSLAAQEKGIQLLHFWNFEIDKKLDILESIILSKCGLLKDKIYARNCYVEEIDNETYRNFCDENHLQGSDNAKVKLGLFTEEDDELVSVMSFAKPVYNNKFEWEMKRFCNKKFYQVIGGASKLFNFFIKIYSPKNMISYADFRISNGNLYKKLGFKFSHLTKPNYFYWSIKTGQIVSRLQAQKHKLKDLLECFDSNLSEVENMMKHGFDRVFDCGNLVFVWKR